MGRPRKYFLNENYFEKIDNSDKAYILGFLYADGGVYKNRLEITLSIIDIEILEFIKNRLNYGGIITTIIINNKRYSKLTITSKKMYNDLINIGIIPNKTYMSKVLPKIKDEYIWHFIRGFFDGDGSIYSSNYKSITEYTVNFSNNINVLNEIKVLLKKYDISSSNVRHRYKNNDISCMLDIKGTFNLEKFYTLMYMNADFYLNRKHNRFEEFNNNKKNIKHKHFSQKTISEIKELYLNNVKQIEISKILEINYSAIRCVIQRLRKMRLID